MDFPTEQQIAEYLYKVDASGVFGRSERRKKLLRHLITAEARGSGGQLKAYSIGLDIFDKDKDFDPQSDSVVRVEVGRLRTGIAQFELTSHADCELKVEIPKGTYRPTLSIRNAVERTADQNPPSKNRKSFRLSWRVAAAVALIGISLLYVWKADGKQSTATHSSITIQVNDLSGARGGEASAILREDILANKAVSVVLQPSEGGLNTEAEFLLSGYSRDEADSSFVQIELVNVSTGKLVWSKGLELDRRNFRQELSDRISRELRVRLFGSSKELLEGRDPKNLSPEQLFVMGTWVPGPAINAVEWELERISLMEIALRKDPAFGAAHSVVADKLAYLANVYGPSNTDKAMDRARFHARRAMELSPFDANVVFNVAQSYWHSGRISESLAAMIRVTELDPNHSLARFLTLVIPFSCAAAPDVVVDQAILFDRSLSSDDPIRWLTLTWIGWLHAYRGEYELALNAEQRAAQIFEIPYTFVRRAMLLNKLGRTEEAALVLDSQKVNWPELDTGHFASVTIPRLCREQTDSQAFIGLYEELDAALKQ